MRPSKYKPQTRKAKNLPLNGPSKYKPPAPGVLYLEIALKDKKQSKNGKFPSNYKASAIDLILKSKLPSIDKLLRILAPPKISPSKRAFEKY